MKIKNKVIFFCLLFLISFNKYTLATPNVSAYSYIVVEKDTGRILASKNPHLKLPMASTTKIMTAILGIEKKINNLEKDVIIPDYCTNIEGSSIYLRTNQKVKYIDLLYGLMLRSGNDAALAVANFACNNNVDSFINDMNNFAKHLGAYNTNFTNPHGLNNANHYTTAYDLALITKYALHNEIFKKIVSAKSYFANSLNRRLYNKNKVVLNYEYGTGVKIGYTKKAGRCISASAQKDNMEVIVVLLNAPNWFNDCYKLFDWAFANYKKYNIILYNQTFLKDELSEKSVLSDNEFSYTLKENELSKINIEFKKFPYIIDNSRNKYYGYYKVYFDKNLIFTGNLKYN